MSNQSVFPFFSDELIKTAKSCPKGSPEWTNALDTISQHIKDFEGCLKAMPDLPSEITTNEGVYSITDSRLCAVVNDENKPIIELPVDQRLDYYNDFPNLFSKLEDSQKLNDEKVDNTDKTSLLNILKDALIRSKEQFNEVGNSELVLRKLKELRATAPKSNESLTQKAQWIKELAKTLLTLKFVEPAIKAIKDEIPKIWNQLTFKQKLQVASIGPILGAGAFIGGVGIAGLGNAVGLPGILVVIVLLFLTNGLIDFIDFCINLVGDSSKINPEYENVRKTFESVFSKGMQEVFKTDFDVGSFQEASSFKETGDKPRDYEFFVVNTLADEYFGKGYVTSQSRDGGIDGYVICRDTKEIILVQSKYYSKKVGFGEATQYLGTLKFWQSEFASKFEFPITKMIIAGPNDFSIEAKRVSKSFQDELVLKTVKF